MISRILDRWKKRKIVPRKERTTGERICTRLHACCYQANTMRAGGIIQNGGGAAGNRGSSNVINIHRSHMHIATVLCTRVHACRMKARGVRTRNNNVYKERYGCTGADKKVPLIFPAFAFCAWRARATVPAAFFWECVVSFLPVKAPWNDYFRFGFLDGCFVSRYTVNEWNSFAEFVRWNSVCIELVGGIASSKFQYFKRVRLDVPVIDFFFFGGKC